MMAITQSLQGSMHARCHIPNQDYVLCRTIKEYTVAAAADGVSLKTNYQFSKSEIASRFCCEFLMDYLAEHLDNDMRPEQWQSALEQGFEACRLALAAKLQALGIFFYDCQTTLLACIYKDGKAAYALAGDGGIVFETEDGEIRFAITKLKTSSTVHPICDQEEWQFGIFDQEAAPIYAIVMATDGVFDQILCYDGYSISCQSELLEQFLALQKLPEEERETRFTQILQEVDSHDDKSCIVLINEKYAPKETDAPLTF